VLHLHGHWLGSFLNRSCLITAWQNSVEAALNEGLTPLLLCPDTVYDELKAIMAADASVRTLDVKPLSPSGLRTKVIPQQPNYFAVDFYSAGQVPRLHGTVQVRQTRSSFPALSLHFRIYSLPSKRPQDQHCTMRTGGSSTCDRHGTRRRQLQRQGESESQHLMKQKQNLSI
jgi:hypothetical protein